MDKILENGGNKTKVKPRSASVPLCSHLQNQTAVYAFEPFVLQETFLSLKIRGLYSRAVSNTVG